VRRGEIYRSDAERPERGNKPSYYVVVSRAFVSEHDPVETVICAPVYSQVLGIPTEVTVDDAHGMHHPSAIRCDFLTLMFKRRLTRYVATLPTEKVRELDRALAIALDLTSP